MNVSVAVALTYPEPVRAEIEVSPASSGCLVESATVMFPVPSNATPFIFRAVVNFGADTIVMTGVVVGVATVSSAVADDTFVTVPPPPPPGAAYVPSALRKLVVPPLVVSATPLNEVAVTAHRSTVSVTEALPITT